MLAAALTGVYLPIFFTIACCLAIIVALLSGGCPRLFPAVEPVPLAELIDRLEEIGYKIPRVRIKRIGRRKVLVKCVSGKFAYRAEVKAIPLLRVVVCRERVGVVTHREIQWLPSKLIPKFDKRVEALKAVMRTEDELSSLSLSVIRGIILLTVEEAGWCLLPC